MVTPSMRLTPEKGFATYVNKVYETAGSKTTISGFKMLVPGMSVHKFSNIPGFEPEQIFDITSSNPTNGGAIITAYMRDALSSGSPFILRAISGHTTNANPYFTFQAYASNGVGLTGSSPLTDTSILARFTNEAVDKFSIYGNGDVEAGGTIKALDGYESSDGSPGLSDTYTFGGGGSGDVATMTFKDGLLTGVTTVT